MTPGETKHAVDQNLGALAEVAAVLTPKVKTAEELIAKTLKELFRYPGILRPAIRMDVELEKVHYDLEICWEETGVELELKGTNWQDLGSREKLLLVEMLPSITAYLATDACKIVNEFPRPSAPAEPTLIDIPTPTFFDASKPQTQPKKRWWQRT